MNSYLAIASKYLSKHKGKTRLTLISVILSISLVVGIFSMLNSLINFEKIQVLKNEGNYHILIRNSDENEISYIKSRIDVKNSGSLKDLGEGQINGANCALGSCDSNFLNNLNMILSDGNAPVKNNEIMLENWYIEKLGLNIGDTVIITMPDKTSGNFIISGIIKDWGVTKAVATPFVFVSENASKELTPLSSQYFILFKDNVDIQSAKNDIKTSLNISDEKIGYNEGLLALMLQTNNNRVIKLYIIGLVLFALVLATGVVMIYNTFNISVMDRVRQFGLLRCIGASKKQIRKLVFRESLIISIKAIPIGIVIGMLITFVCSAILKYFNKSLFGDISIFNVSPVGIIAGALTGFITVFVASFLPANKAARITPLNAITGSNEIVRNKKKKQGILTRLFHIETAIGIDNAINCKKTFILMSSSIAISIMLFLGFSILVNPAFMGMNIKKSFTEDISLSSPTGIDRELVNEISHLDGIKNVSGIKDIANTSQYHTVDIQLKNRNQDQTVNKIKEMIDTTTTLYDKRQMNKEAKDTFMTIAVFIYGFVGVIALISILNLLNTMNTSVTSKTKYYGTMRAIGMSGKQLHKMVLVQAIIYSITGCFIGCVFGIILQIKVLNMLEVVWTFPIWQVLLTIIICMITAALSVINPLNRIKRKGISETIISL